MQRTIAEPEFNFFDYQRLLSTGKTGRMKSLLKLLDASCHLSLVIPDRVYILKLLDLLSILILNLVVNLLNLAVDVFFLICVHSQFIEKLVQLFLYRVAALLSVDHL